MQEHDIQAARAAVNALFQVLGISRVVFVDDLHSTSLEEVIGLCSHLRSAAAEAVAEFREIPFDEDEDIWRKSVRVQWDNLAEGARNRIYQALLAKADAGLDKEIMYGETLSDIFGDLEFKRLSPFNWHCEKERLIQDASTTNTLFLFDREFRKEAEIAASGIDLVREILSWGENSTILCGLLSHTFSPESEHEIWESFEQLGIDRDKCVPISKQQLESEPMSFARKIKLTVINPHCKSLKERAAEVILEANQDAIRQVENIGIYDLEHIVFQSSRREGIWEPDTLFRLFGLFHRTNALRLARVDDGLHELAGKIRDISAIKTDTGLAPPHGSWKIQRLELYEGDDDVNALRLPLQLGDIFEKIPGDKKFILLAQSCDLMVRSDGKRHHAVNEAALVEITTTMPSEHESFFELPYFDLETGRTCYVSFRKRHNVNLSILDLCVYRTDGLAEISLSDPCPSHLVPGWGLRYEILKAEVAKAIERSKQQQASKVPGDILRLLVPWSSGHGVIKGTIDTSREAVSFKCRRVGRMRPPRTGALLTKFGNYISRAAFEHDFGREESLDEQPENES